MYLPFLGLKCGLYGNTMKVDKIKILKFENAIDGTEVDEYQTEADPQEDYAAIKGIAFENSDNHRIDLTNSEITFRDTVNGSVLLGNLVNASGSGVVSHIADQTIHFTEDSINHSNIQNIGNSSHSKIDSHIDNANIHFTEQSINHSNIANIGTNSHSQLDGHVADNSIHFTEASINHSNIQNIGTYSHSAIDSHIDNTGFHFSEESINHSNIQNIGTYTHSSIDGHIDNLTIHRELDDASTTTSSLWSSEKIDSAITASVAPLKIFHAYDAVGNIDITSGWTDITFDTEVKKDEDYSHANDSAEITIQRSDWYLVSYYISTNETSSGRAQSVAKLQKDTGSGYADIPGTIGVMYNRTTAQGGTNASVSITHQFSAGDKIKLVAQRDSGAETIVTVPNSCGILINSIVARGQKGDVGSGSNIYIQDESGNLPNSPHTTLNFEGNLVNAQDIDGSTATVTVSSIALDNHLADNSIHFTEASIDHSSIQGIGVNTHSSIDTHIDDETIHFTEEQHRGFDTLVHNLAETLYESYVRSGAKVDKIVYYTNSSAITKIREESYIRAGNNVSSIITKQYNASGILTETLRQTYTRSSGKVVSVDWSYS